MSRTDHAAILEAARRFYEMDFKILATEGTKKNLAKNNIESELVFKMGEGSPDISEMISKGLVNLVINTPIGKASITDDSYIRKAAIRHKVPYKTTTAAAIAAAKGIAACLANPGVVKSIQEYHKELR